MRSTHKTIQFIVNIRVSPLKNNSIAAFFTALEDRPLAAKAETEPVPIVKSTLPVEI